MESYNQNNKPHKPNSSSYKHENSSPTDLLSSAKLLGDAAMSTFRHEKGKVEMSQAAGAADNLLHAASQYGHLEEKSFGKYIETAEGYLHKYAAPQTSTNQSKPSKFKNNQEEEYEDEDEEEERPRPPSHGTGGKVKKQQYYEEEEDERSAYHGTGGKVKKQQYEEEEEERPVYHGTGGKIKKQQYYEEEEEERPAYHASGKVKKQQYKEEEEEEEEGGGIGNYMKLAQGFMKSQGGGGGGHSGNSTGGDSGAGVGEYMKMAQGFLGKR